MSKWTPTASSNPRLLFKPKRVGIEDLALVSARVPLVDLVNATLANNQPNLQELWEQAGGSHGRVRAPKFKSGKLFDWSGERRLKAGRQGEGGGGGGGSSEEGEEGNGMRFGR